MEYKKRCKACGEPFITTHHRALYCCEEHRGKKPCSKCGVNLTGRQDGYCYECVSMSMSEFKMYIEGLNNDA